MRTLYRNGRFDTPRPPDHPAATAMLVEDATVLAVGREDRLTPDATGAGTRVVDLDGAWVAPAFVDAHVHATSTGLALSALDLGGARTLAQALDAVERAARAGRGRPVLGGGWDETTWPERRPPTAAELDRASYGGAVYLARVDVHSAVVSTALLATVPGLAALPGYRRDGVLTRAAHDAARTAALGALSADRTVELQRTALRHAAAHGIACVHEMAGPAISSESDLRSLLDLVAAEALPRVIGYWGELGGVEAARRLGAVGAGGDLFCDGSLGSHTAALHEPYTDRPATTGMLRFATDEVAEHLVACTEAGVQAGFHAIGDAAVDQVLTAAERAGARLGRPVGPGHRLEHAEFVREPGRLARSGITASMQPLFDATWGGSGGMYAERLGAERAGRLNRFAELAAAGVPLALGSDAPVTPLGAWAAVRAAVHPHDPAAGLDPRTAFAAHTVGGWRAGRVEGAGLLEPGAPATFAVWRTGNLGADGLPDLRPDGELPECLATVLDGTVLYDAGVLPPSER